MPWPALACLFLISFGASAQSLHLSSASGAPGEDIFVRISLDSPPGRSPATLQWELVFPAQILELRKPAVEQSPAVRSAGKSLTCAERSTYAQVCILAGGQRPIANGVIAFVRLKIRADAKTGMINIRAVKVQGAAPDLKLLHVNDAEATITIR